jgi:hypothetical protein
LRVGHQDERVAEKIILFVRRKREELERQRRREKGYWKECKEYSLWRMNEDDVENLVRSLDEREEEELVKGMLEILI